jgi:hypothetical protein
MKARRPSLFLFFATLSVLAAVPARAEVPEAGLRERQWELARAYERFGLADMVLEFALTAQAKP